MSPQAGSERTVRTGRYKRPALQVWLEKFSPATGLGYAIVQIHIRYTSLHLPYFYSSSETLLPFRSQASFLDQLHLTLRISSVLLSFPSHTLSPDNSTSSSANYISLFANCTSLSAYHQYIHHFLVASVLFANDSYSALVPSPLYSLTATTTITLSPYLYHPQRSRKCLTSISNNQITTGNTNLIINQIHTHNVPRPPPALPGQAPA